MPGVEVSLNLVDRWPEWASIRTDILTAIRVTLSAVAPEVGGELSVTLLTQTEIRDLNLRHLDRDGPTDVLSFSLGEEGDLVGDVYVCPEQVAANAAVHGVSAREEALRVVIHGTLHTLGLDHPEEDRDSSAMFLLQERLLRSIVEG